MPANPKHAEFTQPDGTRIKLRLHGDEHFHWLADLDGFTVVRDKKGAYTYARLNANNKLVPTDLAVGRVNPFNIGLKKRTLPPRSALSQLHRSVSSGSSTASDTQEITLNSVATTGTLRNLVVLVSFSDKAVEYTTTQFDNLFNQIGYNTDGAVGSVKDFYNEVSYNALDIQSTVVEPVTLDYGYAYYGANNAYGNDIKPREMVQEALVKLEERGFDFSTMDGDGDGWVDCLTIVHAGGGEEYNGNNSDYIWSHKWQLSSAVYYDGVGMQDYHTVPARRGWDSSPSTQGITRIGVICHEMGHILGLPDLYDYDYDSEGAGDFCLMAGGSWNGDYGTSPAHPSAWCKVDLGWITPTVISVDDSYTIPAVENEPNIYKLQGSFPSNEYFLVENRQGIGFDAYLPGSQRGLLIWHVDESQPDNDDQTHYKVDLEEAGGTQHLELNENEGEDSDYFRTGNATMFTDTATPDNYSYSDIPLGLNITDIGPTGTTIQFTVGYSNALHHFEWGPISNQLVNVPLETVITAKDAAGRTATDFDGIANLLALITGDIDEIEIATGDKSLTYLINDYYKKRRTQSVYLAGELGGAGTITDLALYVTEVPAIVRNSWTIRMKHTTAGQFSSSDWESTGWIVAYQNDEPPGSTGWQYYHFTTPFEYNGIDNLMIDFSFDNTTKNEGAKGLVYKTPTAAYRSIAYKIDDLENYYGSPTTWSGSTPPGDLCSWVPNIMLKVVITPDQPIQITPTATGNFIDGIWTGNVTVLEPAAGVVLCAEANDIAGDSNSLDVTECNLPAINISEPPNGATDVSIGQLLSWTASGNSCPSVYDVYFDSAYPPITLLCEDTDETICDPVLRCSTTYYWQVVATNCCGSSTAGSIWSFTTASLPVDFDLSCITDYSDLVLLTGSWLQNNPNVDIAPPGGDGIINFDDLAAFALYWLNQLAE